MLISNAKKFVFIETPKTASTSMRALLSEFEDEDHDFAKHMAAKHFLLEVGPNRWNDYYSFAVMREPVDWLHSWYKFWRGRAKANQLNKDRACILEMDFEEFVEQAAQHSPKEPFGSIGMQTNRFCSPGTSSPMVTRLMCYDRLSSEWESLKRELLLPELKALPKRNVSKDDSILPELGKATRTIVKKRWAVDFDVYEQLESGSPSSGSIS